MRKFLLTTAVLSLLGHDALAQSAVAVRSGQHDTHTRVVFDWPVATTYDVSQKSPGQIIMTFGQAVSLNTGAIRNDDVLKGISSTGTSATVMIAEGATFRHFLIGNKIVLDIFKADADRPKAIPDKQITQAPVAVSQKIPEKTPVVPVANEGPSVVPEAVVPVEQGNIQAAIPDMDPHVITMSSTETFGLAVFERDGTLWIIADRPTANIPPQIAGPRTELFPKFERMELSSGAIAYSLKIPQGVKPEIRAEGGGLVWRIILPTTRKEGKTVNPGRQFAAGQDIRGGKIYWPVKGVTKIIDMKDPVTGDSIKIAAVGASNQRIDLAYDFVDFYTIPSVVGAAVFPKVDDLSVSQTATGLSVTRPGGLAIARDADVSRRLMRDDVQNANPAQENLSQEGIRRIFDFDRWMMGGLTALNDNERILKSALPTKQQQEKVQDLLTLTKMNVSNDRGQEALGYLDLAEVEMPQLAENLEYLALRGAAYALSGKYEIAWKDFSSAGLNDFNELGYWKAYTLAWLEDWDQAYKELPKNTEVLGNYPRPLLEKMALKLGEVALRGGDPKLADSILVMLELDRATLRPWTLAGLDYLRGEAKRQSKDYVEARKLWEPLIEGKDRLYRARSGLALTILELNNGDIKSDKAIDRLEGLRYAWRGDELEAQINYMLGKFYLDEKKYVKGFTILRDASTMALPDSNIGKEITGYMAEAYRRLIAEDKELNPLDAATIYEEFKELTPPGSAGDAVIQRLAERLVDVDLLDRATALLQHQFDYRLQGAEKARVGVRLAGIYLLDKNPRPALDILDKLQEIYQADASLNDAARKERGREIALLRARGLSKINRTEEAITLLNQLEPDPDINRLRADISWQAGLWEDAAEALQDLIIDEALDPNRPLTIDQSDLVLNRAVSLNLSGNRVALANMRTQYEGAMNKTPRGRLFEVVTRPRKVSSLSDRETIASIVSEVDMFKDFLETYRKAGEPDNTPEKVSN